MIKRALLLIFVLVFAASCSQWDRLTGNHVIKVGKVKLYKDDIQAEMATIASFSGQLYQGAEGTAKFVRELADKEILYLEAIKRGFHQDKVFLKRFEETAGEAKDRGIKQVNGVQPWQRNLLVGYFMEKELGPVSKVTEAELKDFYDSHRYQVRISLIMVPDRMAARHVYKRIRDGGSFAEAASELSLDKESAKAGGDLGWFSPLSGGKLDQRVGRMISILRKGDVSGPVITDNGVDIIKATDIRPDSASFDKVKDDLSLKLTLEKRRAAYDRLLEALKGVYKVEINEKAVARLSFPPLAGNPRQPAGQP